MRTPEEIVEQARLLPPEERRRIAEELLDSLPGEKATADALRMAPGKVVGGKVVVDGEPFADGTTVAVLAMNDDDPLELTLDQEAELVRRMSEVRNGNYLDGDEFILRHLS